MHGHWPSPCCPGRRWHSCSSSTAGRSRSSTRSPRPAGRCWARVSSPPRPGCSSGPRSRRWRRRLQVIAAAQAAEARRHAPGHGRAETQAAEAIAASEAIRAAAAADAIRALIAAGIVEEEAAHEAVEALSAAGLISRRGRRGGGGGGRRGRGRGDRRPTRRRRRRSPRTRQQCWRPTRRRRRRSRRTRRSAAADEVAAEAARSRRPVRAASITVAEARVLRYLPTRLTFALIADKLGISRSAAKERAERAYKKLGVHSRAEAVSRARALGLIR